MDDGTVVTIEFEETGLAGTIAQIDTFLKAAGYSYDGELNIISEEK